MNFPFYIARRYVRSQSRQNAVNIINFITFLVIVIGSAALFIVLSGFAGLKAFSLSFSNTFDPDLKALPATGKFFLISPEQEKKLNDIGGLAAYSKEIEERVSLSHNQKNHIAHIKGIDGNYPLTNNIDSILYYGEWQMGQQTGVAGIGIINLLGLTINQYRNPLVVIAPKPGKGSLSPQGINTTKPYNELPLVITGVYQLEVNLDRKYIFAQLPLVQALLEKEHNEFSGINFKLREDANEEKVRYQITAIFDNTIVLQTRRETNTAL
ncbi:MAG: ABC transporter permease, partial [Flavobacteriaceae bacterium]